MNINEAKQKGHKIEIKEIKPGKPVVKTKHQGFEELKEITVEQYNTKKAERKLIKKAVKSELKNIKSITKEKIKSEKLAKKEAKGQFKLNKELNKLEEKKAEIKSTEMWGVKKGFLNLYQMAKESVWFSPTSGMFKALGIKIELPFPALPFIIRLRRNVAYKIQEVEETGQIRIDSWLHKTFFWRPVLQSDVFYGVHKVETQVSARWVFFNKTVVKVSFISKTSGDSNKGAWEYGNGFVPDALQTLKVIDATWNYTFKVPSIKTGRELSKFFTDRIVK